MGIIHRIGRALRLLEAPKPVDDASKLKEISIHVEELGSSGIENYSGYYSEEYLSNLRGRQAAELWDKMRRSDPKIKMVLSAVKNPIKGANWRIEPAQDGDNFRLHAELIEQILFNDLAQSWTQQLSEILSYLDFGFAPFEVIHKLVTNHPKFGSYNSIAKLAWRNPKTIERWNLDPKTGALLSISQYAFGDLQRLVDIPGEFLLVFTNEREGDNYEGISTLRACYGPWFRKNAYLKLMAIGIEKFAVPTPYMEVPEGKETGIQYTNAKKVLERYVSHQQQYITLPAGWKLNFANSTFDASKIREAIDKENTEISNAFLANFLELGQSGSGSYALGTDLSDFFLTGIEHVANHIAETFNRSLIPNLIKLNFGPQDYYPTLVCTGITDKPGKELAEIVKLLADGHVITPDSDLEDAMREKYGLPPKMDVSPEPQNPQSVQVPQLTERVKLVEAPKTPRSLITSKTEELKQIMQGMLGDIGGQVIRDLMVLKKKSTLSQYLNITNQVAPTGSRDYKIELRDFLAQTSRDAIEQAKKEIPGGSKIKFAEKIGSVKFASNDDFFNALPKPIQQAITAQTGLLTQFQIQDLMKAIYFQFNNSVDSTDSDDQIEADLNETLDDFLGGASVAAGAGNTVAKTVNEARNEFFFDDDVLEAIESFTFVNGDPVSPICQDLAGTVFSKDDPNMDRYSPPLHHNCKSYIVPNLQGSKKEIDPDGLTPSKASLEKYITLAEVSTQIMGGQFALTYIDVSKKVAFTADEAKQLASQFTALDPSQGVTESDMSYRINLKDVGLFEDGTLKSFEPMEGVLVYYGRMKSQ